MAQQLRALGVVTDPKVERSSESVCCVCFFKGIDYKLALKPSWGFGMGARSLLSLSFCLVSLFLVFKARLPCP